MVKSPSREANWFAASHEIPRISRNPKVHYRTHKRPSPVSILGPPNPVHIPTSHLLEIREYVVQPAHIIQYERVRAAELLGLTSTHSQMSETVYYEL